MSFNLTSWVIFLLEVDVLWASSKLFFFSPHPLPLIWSEFTYWGLRPRQGQEFTEVRVHKHQSEAVCTLSKGIFPVIFSTGRGGVGTLRGFSCQHTKNPIILGLHIMKVKRCLLCFENEPQNLNLYYRIQYK